MSIPNFPSTGLVPNVTTFTVGNILYMWDGEKWKSITAPLKADQITWKDGKTAGYALNDLDGFTDALFAEAGIAPSGNPDTVNNSQRVKAVKQITASSIASVSGLPAGKLSQQVSVASYYADSYEGGGLFVWDATKLKNTHNGGTIIDPTAIFPVDWSDQTQIDAWFNSANTGEGVWVRQYDSVIDLRWFGATGIVGGADADAFIAAVKSGTKVTAPFKLYFNKSVVIDVGTRNVELVGDFNIESDYTWGVGYWTGGHTIALTVVCGNFLFDTLTVKPASVGTPMWNLKDEKLVKWSTALSLTCLRVVGKTLNINEAFGSGFNIRNVNTIDIGSYTATNVGCAHGLTNDYDACGDALYISNYADGAIVRIGSMKCVGNRKPFISTADDLADRNISRIAITTEFAPNKVITVNVGYFYARNYQRTLHSEAVGGTDYNFSYVDIAETPMLAFNDANKRGCDLNILGGSIAIANHLAFVNTGIGRRVRGGKISNTKIVSQVHQNNSTGDLSFVNCDITLLAGADSEFSNPVYTDCTLNMSGAGVYSGVATLHSCNVTFKATPAAPNYVFIDSDVTFPMAALPFGTIKGGVVHCLDKTIESEVDWPRNDTRVVSPSGVIYPTRQSRDVLHSVSGAGAVDVDISNIMSQVVYGSSYYEIMLVCSDGNPGQRLPLRGASASHYLLHYSGGDFRVYQSYNSGGLNLTIDAVAGTVSKSGYTDVIEFYIKEIGRTEYLLSV